MKGAFTGSWLNQWDICKSPEACRSWSDSPENYAKCKKAKLQIARLLSCNLIEKINL
jgi:hypothetical protein